MIRKILNCIICFMFTGLLSLSGCNTDPTFQLELWVQNDLSEDVMVSLTDFLYYGSATADTVYDVPANGSIFIHISQVIGTPRDLYSESFTLFESVTIMKEDGATSPKDFAMREEWDYEQVGEKKAVYTLLIDESDF